MSDRLPTPLLGYRIGTSLLGPVVAPLWLQWRTGRGKEDGKRVAERYGRPARARPEGDIVWAHGASIGESLALLPLVEELVGRGLKVLVTSGTLTSAQILESRLPPGARHQFLPLDVPRYLRRFLAHWRPRLVLFAESELWPNTVVEVARQSIPLILVNARLSERSWERWQRAPAVARALFARCTLCIAQSDADAERLASLGAPLSEVSGNLKFDVPPLPADPAAVERLAASVAGRAIWMAASIHPGEDEAILDAHSALSRSRPRALTVIAPRHPERGPEIAAAAQARRLNALLRSGGASLGDADELYIADSVGELGLFYRLAPLVFMGGSLVPHGGQNPFEPARLGAAVVHGPHTANFAEIYAALDDSGAALRIEDGRALAAAVPELLADAALVRDMSRAAADVTSSLGGALERTLRAIEPYLPPRSSPSKAFW